MWCVQYQTLQRAIDATMDISSPQTIMVYPGEKAKK